MSDRKKLLVISCHAVDWLWRAGGTIANYIKQGAEVKVIDLSTGAYGESEAIWNNNPGITWQEVDAIRKKETGAAAAVLGISEVEFFDFEEHYLMMDREQIMRLALAIRKFRPDIILTHAAHDPKNPDHETGFKATLAAISASIAEGTFPDITPAHKPALYSFEPDLTELSGFKPDTYIDITDSYDIKVAAMRCVESQPNVVYGYELRGKVRGQQSARFVEGEKKVVYAEAFQRVFAFVGDTFEHGYSSKSIEPLEK